MQTIITGPVTVIGKNIDTDQIYPGRYLALTDPKEIGSHCLSGLDENIAPNFQKGGLASLSRKPTLAAVPAGNMPRLLS